MLKLLFLVVLSISLPGFGQEDDDAIIRELETERLKQVETAIQLNETKDTIVGSTASALEELQQLGGGKLSLETLSNEKALPLIEKLLEESDLRNQDPELIRSMILNKVQGKPFEKLFTDFPVILNISIDVLKDKEALLGFVRVLGKKDDLKNYSYFLLGIFVFLILLKKFVIPKSWSFFKKISASIVLSLFGTALSLILFYQFFPKDIGPTYKIIKHHLLKT